MYYYRARYYSTALGRFLQTDPIGSKDDINLYAYTGGDPVNISDPTGTEATHNCHLVAYEDCGGAGLTSIEGYNVTDIATDEYPAFDRVMDSDSQGNGADSSKNSSRGRPLTPGEVTGARSSHPDIDTDSITIEYNWWDFLGGFTPHNTIHFPSRMEYCQDFSSCDGGNNFGWFIHEVTHAWRYQLGDSPFWGHIFSRDLFKSGDYLTFQQYRLLKSPAGLPAEEEADWYEWDALYGNRGGK